MPFGASQQFPPTPTSSQRNSRYQGEEEIMFNNAEAGPSNALAHSLPPTPPINAGNEKLNFEEPTITQRPRKGRRPASVYPSSDEHQYQVQRKHTDPTSESREYRLDDSPGLDVDLDAYSTTDFDAEEREPTLSFLTSSTAESTTGTPASIGGAFDYKPEYGKNLEGEPRIRMRSTAGRTNAYSSAESSMASGAYSYHAYADNNVYHPHPPPMPTLPTAFAQRPEQMGLGIIPQDMGGSSGQHESQGNPSPGPQLSPANSFAHRPWKRDVANRLRSDSASSVVTTASMSTSDSHMSGTAASLSSQPYPFAGYAENLPWEREELQDAPEAIALVEEGKDKMFNAEKLEQMGGVSGLTEDVINSLRGTTHLLLPDVGSEILTVLTPLLSAFAASLVVLDLANNDLSFLPDAMQYCSSLEELNISGNPIRVLPNWIGDLAALRMLVVDNCGLQSLPSDISALTSLHTICARRNRLVSLPSWLCLLSQLETLRIDENPFANEWKPIVAPILANPQSELGQLPVWTSSQPGFLRSQSSVASFDSTQGSVAREATDATQTSHGGPISRSSSSAHSLYQLSALNPIAEDQPRSAPIEASASMMPPFASTHDSSPLAPKGLRKMRSAGNLLGVRDTSPIGSRPGGERSGNIIPPQPTRFVSLGARPLRTTSVADKTDADVELSPPSRSNALAANQTTKTGKWGFLRKMSMHKLRPDKSEKPEKTLAASATANLNSLPPLVHASSDFVPGHRIRPSLNATRSAMTLPTRSANDFGEFRSANASSSSLGPPIGSLPVVSSSSIPRRGKRRSFLPVDGPPSLNITIPSTSPFMPPTSAFTGERALPTASSDSSSNLHTSMSKLVVDSPLDADPEARYARGLDTIKSYLRDLFDLSRAPIEPYGGFEVLSTTDGSCANSSAPSDSIASPASNLRGSVSEARRARRPTLDAPISRHASSASVVDSARSFTGNVSETSEGKKFKNDKAKRARVIREIYETERTYVRGLGELVNIYVRPSAQPASSSKGETVIPAAERKVVFGGIESIMAMHRDNLLPALEKAVTPLLEGKDDEEGELSARTAHAVGEVFRTYIAYMKQYSTYINNFDNALSRMKTWTAPTSAPGTPGYAPKTPVSAPSISSAAISAGVGMGVISLPGDPVPLSNNQMTASQRKRVKIFMKRCREHPMHSQINLESYLLLPIQRVPRYKLLLEDLAMCTLPRNDGPRDTLDDALNEISSLASLMNEEKRDADSRLRLLHWQQRISSRGPSPLVQPHRKLIMDGSLTLIRLVKKASSFVEVDGQISDNDMTITPSKVVVPIEYIAPEPMDRPMMLILCSDLLVLVQQRYGQKSWEGQVDLFNVLRMATLREPASMINGSVLRVVDNKSIYYFQGASPSNTLEWCRAINSARRR